jgi:hypothetical protein
MRGRTILILLGVLVVLAGVATLLEKGRSRKTTLKGVLLIPGMKTELVDQIRFKSEGKNVTLEKKSGTWVVATEGGNVAEKRFVDDMLEALHKCTADEVVSTNPGNHGLFMADTSGTELWVDQQGKEIAHLFVGKPGPDMLSTYVRAASSNKVILTRGYLPSLFQGKDTWRQKTLVSVKWEDIKRFEYTSPSRGDFLIVKNDAGIWHIEKPDTGRADPNRVSLPLRTVSNLKADGFADAIDPVTAGFGADTSHVSITTADGATYTVQIGLPAEGGRNYVRLDGSTQIYTMARGRINTLMIPQPAAKLAPSGN